MEEYILSTWCLPIFLASSLVLFEGRVNLSFYCLECDGCSHLKPCTDIALCLGPSAHPLMHDNCLPIT